MVQMRKHNEANYESQGQRIVGTAASQNRLWSCKSILGGKERESSSIPLTRKAPKSKNSAWQLRRSLWRRSYLSVKADIERIVSNAVEHLGGIDTLAVQYPVPCTWHGDGEGL